MTKEEFTDGSSKIADFFYWINERHRIYLEKSRGVLKPWTEDKIFQRYKFTNVFRQLDTGTLWYQKMTKDHVALMYDEEDETAWMEMAGDLLFNTIWYRLFNYWEHANELGFVYDAKHLMEYFTDRRKEEKKIFTSAHLTGSSPQGLAKWRYYIDTMYEYWQDRQEIIESIMGGSDPVSMQNAFSYLVRCKLIGGFIGYEIVCDLRFTPILDGAPDKLTWANVGPGARRGMKRLGMKPSIDSMIDLYKIAPKYLCSWVMGHYDGRTNPPFELREIEHSLCEFDKYERVRLGQGRPRGRYNGESESE